MHSLALVALVAAAPASSPWTGEADLARRALSGPGNARAAAIARDLLGDLAGMAPATDAPPPRRPAPRTWTPPTAEVDVEVEVEAPPAAPALPPAGLGPVEATAAPAPAPEALVAGAEDGEVGATELYAQAAASPSPDETRARLDALMRRYKVGSGEGSSAPQAAPRPEPAAPEARPMIFLGAGIVEVQPADATARSSLPSGGTRHLDWGTEVWTGPRTRTLVVLPEKGGEVVLSPESKVRLDRDGVVVTAGEARVTVPHRGENPLQVETPRGRLEIQPGGEARVRPREFARVRGEVARVGQG